VLGDDAEDVTFLCKKRLSAVFRPVGKVIDVNSPGLVAVDVYVGVLAEFGLAEIVGLMTCSVKGDSDTGALWNLIGILYQSACLGNYVLERDSRLLNQPRKRVEAIQMPDVSLSASADYVQLFLLAHPPDAAVDRLVILSLPKGWVLGP
jgi:hypothetical protein